jgi:hypothetical protein
MAMKVNGYTITKTEYGIYRVEDDDGLYLFYPTKKAAVHAAETDFLGERNA